LGALQGAEDNQFNNLKLGNQNNNNNNNDNRATGQPRKGAAAADLEVRVKGVGIDSEEPRRTALLLLTEVDG